MTVRLLISPPGKLSRIYINDMEEFVGEESFVLIIKCSV